LKWGKSVHWRLKAYLAFFYICFSASSVLSHEINIDGKLDDSAWKSADEYTKYYESLPFTLNEPKDFQKVLILEDEKGIYLGFINKQDKETIRANRHERDDEMANADKAGLAIDFDGDGLAAYAFTVSAGGSISDGIYRNENEVNYDWDADWKSGVFVDKDYWYVEMFIPWSIAPMKAINGEFREVKLSFWRLLAAEWRVNTTIKGNPRQEKFISLFHPYKFKNYSVSKIDFFPYVTALDDRVLNETNEKVGAEIFWKIDSGKQLNIAINPDFGQVESDELVVNFSSSETFYSDKRPFFSENHSLFDVKGYTYFYLINTRRIGAAPDYNCSSFEGSLKDYCESSQVGINDIDYAIRYTQQGETLDFGFLGASEADETFSQGRDFYSLRARKNFEDFSLGYLSTHTDRPVLDRTAEVHSMDLVYRYSDKTRIDAIYITSDTEQGIDNSEKSGEAFRFRLTSSPTSQRYTDAFLFFFDEDTDINDMGYQIIDDYFFGGVQNGYKKNDFNESSIFLSNTFEFGVGHEANGDLIKSNDFLYLNNKTTFRDTSYLESSIFYRTKTKDFWITRGNPTYWYVNKPKNYGGALQYKGASQDFFNYYIEYKRQMGEQFGGSALGFSNIYTAKLDFAPRDNLNFSLMYNYAEEDDWLNWIQDNFFGIYQKKQKTTIASINWFGGDKHELRLKAQMVGFTARDPKPYLSDIEGNLNSIDTQIDPFTLSDLAFQIRYRYEILPLAYLYVVYSRGGRIVEFDEEDSLSEIYKRPWNDPQADTFTVKVRYRF
jgi:hypothetical protein